MSESESSAGFSLKSLFASYNFTRGKLALLATGLSLIIGGGVTQALQPESAAESAATSPKFSASNDRIELDSAGTLPIGDGKSVAVGGPTSSLIDGAQAGLPVSIDLDHGGNAPDPADLSQSQQPDRGQSPDVLPKSSDESAEPWSPAMFRGGLGVFLGFSVGIALRMFVRFAALVVGLQLVIMLLFSYVGWIEVHWQVIDANVGAVFENFSQQFASFQSFVTGHIPTAGLSSLGLVFGWRKQ